MTAVQPAVGVLLIGRLDLRHHDDHADAYADQLLHLAAACSVGAVITNTPSAARALGWSEIEAFVIADDDRLDNELREIDENLCRAELTPAQRAHAIKRRKEIWEARNLAAGTNCSTSLPDGRKAGPQHEKQFAADTAEATGQSKQDINRHVSRAEALGDDLLEVAGTSLDKGVELDALKAMPVPARPRRTMSHQLVIMVRSTDFTRSTPT